MASAKLPVPKVPEVVTSPEPVVTTKPHQGDFYSLKHIIKRANMLKKQLVQQRQEELIDKPYTDPARVLNRGNFEEIATVHLESEATKQKLYDSISQDQKIISLLLMENDGSTEHHSVLQSKWNAVKSSGGVDQGELLAYVRFLTGLGETTRTAGRRPARAAATRFSKLSSRIQA